MALAHYRKYRINDNSLRHNNYVGKRFGDPRGENMTDNRISVTPSAYTYPLLIKHLLHTPLAWAPEQEIVYRGEKRYSYRTLRERIGKLASGLTSLGIKA